MPKKTKLTRSIPKITPFLWFDDQAEAAGKFFSLFKHSARLAPNRPMRHAMILGYVGVVLALVPTGTLAAPCAQGWAA